MRVAICISGFLRLCETTFESFRRCLIEPFEPDIFISTWEAEGGGGQRADEVAAIYRPKAVEVESWPEVLASWGDLTPWESRKRRDVTVPNVLGMFYKIYRANQLKRAAEAAQGGRYDVVVRVRTDLMFYDAPNLARTVPGYVAIGNTFGYGGLPDLFASGDSASMDVYADLFRRIAAYVNEGCIVHPEMLLEWHVKRALPQGVAFSDVPYRLVRPAGTAAPTVWCIR